MPYPLRHILYLAIFIASAFSSPVWAQDAGDTEDSSGSSQDTMSNVSDTAQDVADTVQNVQNIKNGTSTSSSYVATPSPAMQRNGLTTYNGQGWQNTTGNSQSNASPHSSYGHRMQPSQQGDHGQWRHNGGRREWRRHEEFHHEREHHRNFQQNHAPTQGNQQNYQQFNQQNINASNTASHHKGRRPLRPGKHLIPPH